MDFSWEEILKTYMATVSNKKEQAKSKCKSIKSLDDLYACKCILRPLTEKVKDTLKPPLEYTPLKPFSDLSSSTDFWSSSTEDEIIKNINKKMALFMNTGGS
jgi:hypothetical protein